MLGTHSSPSQESLLARARTELASRRATLPDEPLPQEILDSWARCFDAGLDIAHRPELPVLEAADLQRHREQTNRVRQLALSEIDSLFQQIAGSNFLLAFADRDGYILDLYADNRFSASASGERILPGSQWTEATAGTNGLGTALASGRPVAVNGPEHFFGSLSDISCAASPIRDAEGRIVGAIDASSYFESRQRHTHALVRMAATQVENVLLAEQRAHHLVLAIHPRPEFVGTISAGLLAFDGEGRVSAFNARAKSLLAGLDLQRETAFEALFNEPYARLLARLHAGGDEQLRDALGSTLAASWVNRPLRTARVAGAGLPRPAALDPVPSFVAEDAAVREAAGTVAAAARRGLPILIHGETGSGKELLARYAHEASGRRGAFVAVNCGALSSELFEAELFGYVGGAYTGARREGSEGLLASADGGTLLLDEVRELPLALQPVLLRFLDDRLVRQVGGRSSRSIDVQLLAATNADLEQEVAARHFRADLLYRLNTIVLRVPPLRERREDILPLVHHYLAHYAARYARAARPLTAAAVQALQDDAWHGNVRALRHACERAVILGGETRLDAADFQLGAGPSAAPPPSASPAAGARLEDIERDAVAEAMRAAQGNVSEAARRLGVSRAALYRRLDRHGL